MRRTPLKSPMLCRIVGTLGVIVLVLPALYVAAPSSVFAQGAGKEVKEKPIPPGLDVFNLNLGQWIAFSERKNFEVLGHSYFKGPWLSPSAQTNGQGAGFNTPLVYNGIAYLGGYPSTLFGVLIADVKDPRKMQALSFIPCNAGTRCNYIRVNTNRKILVGTQDTNSANPNRLLRGNRSKRG